MTAKRARPRSRPSPRASGDFQPWTASLRPARPFSGRPLDGAVAPPGAGGAFARCHWRVLPSYSWRLALPGLLGAAPGPVFLEHKAAAQSPAPPRLLPQMEEAWVFVIFSSLLGLAIQRILATDFILLKTCCFLSFFCFDLFICLHHASAVLPIAIYQVSHPKPPGRAKGLQFNLISTLI